MNLVQTCLPANNTPSESVLYSTFVSFQMSIDKLQSLGKVSIQTIVLSCVQQVLQTL